MPGDLEAILLACLEKDRETRPASALELQRRLQACDADGEWDGAWWWEEYGPALALDEPGAASSSTATLDIDLARRRAEKIG